LTVTFRFGSAGLTTTASRILYDLAKVLGELTLNDYRLHIDGYTDTVGSREYNVRLSVRRAAAVVDYLADKWHVDRSRMVAVGRGEEGLLVGTPEQTPEPRNRRVSIIGLLNQ